MANSSRGPVWASIATVVWGLALIPGIIAVFFAPMVFDAPGSEKNPQMVAIFNSLVAFPILCAVSIVLSWIAWAIFRRSTRRFAAALQGLIACLPLTAAGVFIYQMFLR